MALYQPDLQTGDAHPFASYLDVHQGYMVLTYISVLHDSLRGVPTLSWGQKGVVGLDTMHPCWTFTTNYSPSLKKCPGGTSPSFKGTCRASPQKIEHQRKLKKRLGNQLDRLCLFGEPHWNLQRKRKFWLQKVSETCRHAQSLWEGPSIMINLVAKSAFSPPPRWGSLDFNRGATHSLPPSFPPIPRQMQWSQWSLIAFDDFPSYPPWLGHKTHLFASDFTISTPPFIDDVHWFSPQTTSKFHVFSPIKTSILHGIHGIHGHGHAEVRLLRPPNPGLGRNLGEVAGPGAAGRLALPSRGAMKNVGISPRKIHGMQGGITSSWKVGM